MNSRAAAVLAALAAGAVVATILIAVLWFDGSSTSTTPTPPGAAQRTAANSVSPISPSTSAATSAPKSGGYRLVPDVTTATFDRMVDFAIAPGTNGQEAVIITQHEGQLWRVSLSGSFQPSLFGDIQGRINKGEEEGLLSLAFSPDYQQDRRVYLYYTSDDCGDGSGCSYLSRFTVDGSGLDEGSETVILKVPQFASNHNGGRVLFGPDGYLYLSLGDGGGGGDPTETGQDNTDLLASILRIDVTGESAYSVPPDNPFVGRPGADEVWAYGLRNPWRYSFDASTGEMWVGDVGQNAWEEVEPVVKGGNYGWDCYEGFQPFETAGCPQGGFQFPRTVYGRNDGQSVIGGYVYRGAVMPELYGWYIYADAYSGKIWAVDTASQTSPPVLLAQTDAFISSFAELPNGELLVLTFNNAIDRLARL